MKTSSCKSKGRRLSQLMKDELLKWQPDLHTDDIIVTPSGVTGVDLMLSPKAKETYPFAIECKNQEAWKLPEWLKQAESHRTETTRPLLVFSRNRSPVYVALKLEDFMWLVR